MKQTHCQYKRSLSYVFYCNSEKKVQIIRQEVNTLKLCLSFNSNGKRESGQMVTARFCSNGDSKQRIRG